MTLVSADLHQVQISLSHAELALLKGYVEHAAEINHDTAFHYPELLSGFRVVTEYLRHAHSEGLLEEG